MIYFIQEENCGPIKIGLCYPQMAGCSVLGSIIERRLILQCGNPRKLYIVGYIEGNRKDEKVLHKKFKHLNILNEWFTASPELISFINKNKALDKEIILNKSIKNGISLKIVQNT